MVPRSMSLGQQYKISPPETEPPLTLLLTSPILSPGLFPVTLLDPPDMLAQIEEWGWLDRFFFSLCVPQWAFAVQKRWHLQG